MARPGSDARHALSVHDANQVICRVCTTKTPECGTWPKCVWAIQQRCRIDTSRNEVICRPRELYALHQVMLVSVLPFFPCSDAICPRNFVVCGSSLDRYSFIESEIASDKPGIPRLDALALKKTIPFAKVSHVLSPMQE